MKAFAGASWTLLAGDAAVALPWDPGTTDAGSLAYAHPDTAPGDYWFRLTTQSTASGGWRTALKVNSGEAHVYPECDDGFLTEGNKENEDRNL